MSHHAAAFTTAVCPTTPHILQSNIPLPMTSRSPKPPFHPKQPSPALEAAGRPHSLSSPIGASTTSSNPRRSVHRPINHQPPGQIGTTHCAQLTFPGTGLTCHVLPPRPVICAPSTYPVRLSTTPAPAVRQARVGALVWRSTLAYPFPHREAWAVVAHPAVEPADLGKHGRGAAAGEARGDVEAG